MKTSHVLQIAFCALFAIAAIGCSSSDDGDGGAFIPTFNATWPVEGTDGAYRMSLQPNEANKNIKSGVFTGEEQHDNDTIRDGNPLSGSFNGLDIEFTVIRDAADRHKDVKFQGTMTPTSKTDHNIVRIDLNSSEGSIALVP